MMMELVKLSASGTTCRAEISDLTDVSKESLNRKTMQQVALAGVAANGEVKGTLGCCWRRSHVTGSQGTTPQL